MRDCLTPNLIGGGMPKLTIEHLEKAPTTKTIYTGPDIESSAFSKLYMVSEELGRS